VLRTERLLILGLALVAYAAAIGFALMLVQPAPAAVPTVIPKPNPPCFAPDVLGTWAFPMCPDGYRYEFKDI